MGDPKRSIRSLPPAPSSPAHARALVEHLGDCVTEYDGSGRLLYVSPSVRDVLGWEPEELFEGDLRDLIHPEDRSEAETSFGAAFDDPPAPVITTRHRHRDGDWRWLEVAHRGYVAPGGERRVVVSSRDVTERHLAARRHQQLTAAMDQAAEAITVLDRAGRVLYANAAFEEMMGCRLEDLEGRTMDVLSNGAEDERLLADIAGSLGEGRPWSGRYGTRWSDGTLRFRDATVAPVRDGAGHVHSYVGVLRDVTRESELELQLHQSQKLEALGKLAGGMAHDFNNLLTVVLGNVEILASGPEDAAVLRESVEAIRDAADRGSRLTHQLLAFGRRGISRHEALDLNAVVADLMPLLRRLIGENVSVRERLAGEPLGVRGDRSQIEQIVTNLVVNARDALPEGGVVGVETDAVRLDSGDPPATLPPGEYARLRVRDDGVGMDEATAARAFDPFFSTKESGEGSGLGLATVYGVVQQSGGSVGIDSAPGRGTTVTVLLPRGPVPETVPASPPAPAPAPAVPSTLLVVEDEAGVRRLMERVLAREGYRVLPCPDGPAALERAARHGAEIDLVLTDVVMPGMDGIRLSAALAPLCPRAGLVFMSGYVPGSMPSLRSLPSGARLMAKPFTPRDLLRTVREALEANGDPPPA